MGMGMDVDVNVQIGSGLDREDVQAYLMQEQMQMQHQHQHQHQHLQPQPQPQPVVNTMPAIPSSQAAVSAVIANFQGPPAHPPVPQPQLHPQNVGQAQQQLPQAQLPRHQQVQQLQRPEPIDVDRLPSTQAPLSQPPSQPPTSIPAPHPAQAQGQRGERTLVTSGCRAFALPAKCLEGYPGFTLNRQEFVGKKVRKLESRGLRKVRSWIEEDTHLIIEWQSSIPVWSDTLQPEIPDLAAAIRMVTSHNSMVASAGASAKAGAGSSGADESPNKRARSSTGQSQGQRRSSSAVVAAEAGASGSQVQAQSQGQGQPPSQVQVQSQPVQSQTKKRRRESAVVPVQSTPPQPPPGPSSTGHAQGGPSSSSASASTSRANSTPHISTPSAPTSTSVPNSTPTSSSAQAGTPIRLPTLGTFSIPSSIPIPLPSPSKVPGQGSGIFKVQTSNDPASQAGADGMVGIAQTQSQPERRVVPDDELFTGTQHGKKVEGTRAKTPAILRWPRSESASVTPTASLKRKAGSVEMSGDGGRDRSASRMPPPLPTPTPESAGSARSSMLTGHRSMPSVVSVPSASSSTPTPKSMSQPRSQLRTSGNPYPVIPPIPTANAKPQTRPPLPGRSRLPLPGRGPKILQGPPPSSQSQSQSQSQAAPQGGTQNQKATPDQKKGRPQPLNPAAPVLATPNPTPSPKRASVTQMPGQAEVQAHAQVQVAKVQQQQQQDLPVAFSPRHKRFSTPSASESASALLEQSMRKPASVPASFRDAIGAPASPAAAAAATTTTVMVVSPGPASLSTLASAFGSVLADAVSSFPVPKAEGTGPTSPPPHATVESSSLLPALPVTEREGVQEPVTQPAVGAGAGSDVRGEEEEQKRGHSSDGDDAAVASALLLASPEGSSSSRGGHSVLPGVVEGAQAGDAAQAEAEGGQDAVMMGHGHDRDVDVAMEDAVDGEMDEDDDADDSSSGDGGEVGMLVIEFLQRYCQLFDADRSKLADAYAPNALFSCRRHDLASAFSTTSTSMPAIAQGRSEIIEKLLTLGAYAFCPRGIPRNLQFDAVVVDPPSDPSSSSVDSAAQGALSIKNLGQGDILLTVHGEIALPHEDGPEQDHVLALDQSLLLRRPPAPDGGAQRGEGEGSGDASEGLELEDPKEPWPLLAISHQMTVRAALLLDAERLEEEEPWMQDILA
ncbi:hypothetical protein CVT26_006268 [Gymnopilus dilepis]|uniref:NTF2 domain-containing protein n=1 Tax=Gymnopilus dilepis TaxID=231916 RepID=A0A409Y166_9AGAR|nr:hypothetical protein CVT26_006268 [Gymnopilus dilepis]